MFTRLLGSHFNGSQHTEEFLVLPPGFHSFYFYCFKMVSLCFSTFLLFFNAVGVFNNNSLSFCSGWMVHFYTLIITKSRVNFFGLGEAASDETIGFTLALILLLAFPVLLFFQNLNHRSTSGVFVQRTFPTFLARRGASAGLLIVAVTVCSWTLLITVDNMLLFFVVVEALGVVPVLLMATARADSASLFAVSASTQYFLVNVFVGAAHLIGLFLLYDITGTISFTDLELFLSELESNGVQIFYISVSFFFFFCPFFFKMGVFPFHWLISSIYEAHSHYFLSSYMTIYKFGVMLAFWFIIIRLLSFSDLDEPAHFITFFLSFSALLTAGLIFYYVYETCTHKAQFGFLTTALEGLSLLSVAGQFFDFDGDLTTAAVSAIFTSLVYSVLIVVHLAAAARTSLRYTGGVAPSFIESDLRRYFRQELYLLTIIIFFLVSGLPPSLTFWWKLNAVGLESGDVGYSYFSIFFWLFAGILLPAIYLSAARRSVFSSDTSSHYQVFLEDTNYAPKLLVCQGGLLACLKANSSTVLLRFFAIVTSSVSNALWVILLFLMLFSVGFSEEFFSELSVLFLQLASV